MDNSATFRHLRRFFSGTLLSRVSGMVRDLSTAFVFGDHPSVAAFMIAFRLSNLVRRLLGEGPFQSAFIPHYEQLRVEGREKDFFRRLTVLLSLLLVVIIVGSELFVQGLSGSTFFSSDTVEIFHIMRWLLPGMLFICLYGLNSSLHHCNHSFFVPSFTPAICNFIWVGAIWFLRDRSALEAMPILAKYVLIGYVGQWLISLPLVLKEASFSPSDWLNLKVPPEVKRFIRFVALAIIGVGAMQINTFFDAIFSRMADLKGPNYLWYSLRLEQFALALFGMAAVSTMIPQISRAIKEGRQERSLQLFSFAFKRLLLVMIPCTFATIVLGLAAVNLLYGRGHFGEQAVLQTTYCLFAYGLGLIPTALIMLFSAVFYAKNRFLLPSLVAVGVMFLNIGLNAFFVMKLHLGCISVAISTTLCAWINCAVLFRQLINEGWTVVNSKWMRLTLASLTASIPVLFLPQMASKGLFFLAQSTTFSLSVICFSYLFNCRELLHFILALLQLTKTPLNLDDGKQATRG